MMINKSGIVIRLAVADVRVMGRATQGVNLINLTKRTDSISSVCVVTTEDEDAEALDASTEAVDEPTTSDAPETTIETNEQIDN